MKKEYDVILITPDRYVDHPSFAHALIKRSLEEQGFFVAVIDAPRWQDKDYFKYGLPKLFWAVSGGNVDSIVMNYTASGRKRKSDDYQINSNPYFADMPKGEKSRIRPDRCINVYVNGIKSADKTTPVVIGGIEASLRRFAHYDMLTKRVRASVLADTGADILVYGMGEKAVCEIAESLKDGMSIKELKIRNTMRFLNKGEEIESVLLPSFDDTRDNKSLFVKMTELIYLNSNPYTGKPLVQGHGGRKVIQFQPDYPLSSGEIDRIYSMPFTYSTEYENVGAFNMIRDSLVSHRGCLGGCSFCSLSVHQGRKIQSRSAMSVKDEVIRRKKIIKQFKVLRDIGGPSADMYGIECSNTDCSRLSCLYPDICPVVKKNPANAHKLYSEVFNLKDKLGKKLLSNLFIGSGLRHDLLLESREYTKYLISNCVSGYLKTAPEHASPKVLDLMKKPRIEVFEKFLGEFRKLSKECGKNQYTIPYIIIGHPGETIDDIYILRDFLKTHGLRAEQVQIFMPTPMTLSTCMYYTETEPFTGKSLSVCTDIKELEKRKDIILSVK